MVEGQWRYVQKNLPNPEKTPVFIDLGFMVSTPTIQSGFILLQLISHSSLVFLLSSNTIRSLANTELRKPKQQSTMPYTPHLEKSLNQTLASQKKNGAAIQSVATALGGSASVSALALFYALLSP